jgi:hypothetical protein
MIMLSFRGGTDVKIPEDLEAKRARIVASVNERTRELMAELVSRVRSKLSGEVLQTRTGKLLGSVKTIEGMAGDRVYGYVIAGGAGLGVYPDVHEYGGRDYYDIYPVNRRALAFFPTGTLGSINRIINVRYKGGKKKGRIRPSKYQAFKDAGGIMVRHVKHPPALERSYMRSSLEEMRQRVIDEIREAIIEGAI